jgi:hypothetical protein
VHKLGCVFTLKKIYVGIIKTTLMYQMYQNDKSLLTYYPAEDINPTTDKDTLRNDYPR